MAQFLALDKNTQRALATQLAKRDGFIDGATTWINFYLLILAAVSATGAVVWGGIVWWKWMSATCRVANNSNPTDGDIAMMNQPLRADPTAAAVLDSTLAHQKNSNSNTVRRAAERMTAARSRESSPDRSNGGEGSSGQAQAYAPPSNISAWTAWGPDNKGQMYQWRANGETCEWARYSKKNKGYVKCSDPR